MRKVLSENSVTAEALGKMAAFHPDIVSEIESALPSNEWVLVGMAQNPVVKKARQFLDQNNTAFRYIEHGSYFSKWKERLAIKLWSGWPTFPQVFHRGKLVGGFEDLKVYFKNQR